MIFFIKLLILSVHVCLAGIMSAVSRTAKSSAYPSTTRDGRGHKYPLTRPHACANHHDLITITTFTNVTRAHVRAFTENGIKK